MNGLSIDVEEEVNILQLSPYRCDPTGGPLTDRTNSSPRDDLPSTDEVPPSQDAHDEDAPLNGEDALGDEDAASKYRR